MDAVVAIDRGNPKLTAQLAIPLFADHGETLARRFVVALKLDMAEALIDLDANLVQDLRLGNVDYDGLARRADASIVADPLVLARYRHPLGDKFLCFRAETSRSSNEK